VGSLKERFGKKKKKQKKKKKKSSRSFKAGTFPRSFVRNPDEGSQLVAPKRSLVAASGGEEAESLKAELADVKKQLAAETNLCTELKKSKAALEGIIAARGGTAATNVVDSSMVEELKKELERKKAEVADLTSKKNKYKKHAKTADAKLKGLKEKVILS
jgi:hypothetical protein